jgi:hypothetical protein
LKLFLGFFFSKRSFAGCCGAKSISKNSSNLQRSLERFFVNSIFKAEL